MKANDVTKTELKKVAKELNEQLGLEPPILLDMKVTALKKKCVDAAALIDPEEDEFSDEVWEVLEALGAASRPDTDEESDVEEEEEETDDVEDTGEGDVVEGEDADEAVAEAMGDTLVADFKDAKKLVELKEVAGAWECFENLDLDSYAGLQGPKKLKADMLACLPDELREQIEPKPMEKAAKPAKEKKVKEKKEPRGASPYGTSVELMCKNTGMSLDDLRKAITDAGFDPEKSRAAIGTAYSSVRKIAGMLEANGWTKP